MTFWDSLQFGARRRRPYLDLFLIGFVILFFELASIRWFGSTVVFLTFFTNVVLLATFLGMSAGCLAASTRRNWIQLVIPLLLLAIVMACGVLWIYEHFGKIMVDVGGQGSPQQVYFGTEYRAHDVAHFIVPIELLAAFFFVLIALVFLGLGQEMGRAFNSARDRLLAYVSNISGSLAGIVAFALVSYLRTTPLVWFLIVLATCVYFLRRWNYVQALSLTAVLLLIGFTTYRDSLRLPWQEASTHDAEIWSPYYKIIYTPHFRVIETNNIGHQEMKAIAAGGEAYSVPYLLNRDSGGKPFDDVLVVGAGSGNDVESALAHGAKHVDAVEIDPAIYDLGRAHHPDHPYQDSRVTMHIEDGRSFLRNSPQKYDLVVYALVDSLMLYSGYSSIRLESFLFTQQAFDDIAARVKPGGMFVVYNFFRQGWIVGRIDKMAESAFGSRPIVISMPYVNSIRPEDPQANRFSMIIASHSAPAFSAIRHAFDLHQSFWINRRPSVNLQVEAFGPQPPALQGSTSADWDRIAPATVDTHAISLVPTDDWPFLYLHSREIPGLNNRSTVLIGVLSFVLLFVLSPGEKARPNWQMFFLGAGFMLLETEAVVHMALLFGSTWTVNSFVFFSILVMILIGNAFVIWIKPVKLWPYYVCLTASLLLNILVPMNRFLVLHQWEKIALSCTVTFLPIFFAAIIFGTLFRNSTQPNVDFGSNVAGAIVGGLSEALTLMIGFNHLMITAVVFYLLSSIVKPTFLTHGLFVGSSVPRTSA